MAVLSLLADPRSYRACEWELSGDAEHRAYWLHLFRTHIRTFVDHLHADAGPEGAARVEAFLHDYLDGLRILDADPRAWDGSLTVLKLCTYRQDVLKRHGFPDPFARIKARETARAIELYPHVVAALDRLEPRPRMEMLARGIFAGNEFDLGCTETTARYHEDGHDFADAVRRVRPRPWPEDDFDRWCACALGRTPAYRRVLFFVDNAGADVVLGCLPLARELSLSGAEVTLAANSEPALNDITIGELDDALGRIRRLDERLDAAVRDGRLRTVASGCKAPLIDLSDVSDACNEASRDADLVILEGMGRSVESNRSARFTCDALWIALIKDSQVARQIGVELFSPIWRFRPGPRGD